MKNVLPDWWHIIFIILLVSIPLAGTAAGLQPVSVRDSSLNPPVGGNGNSGMPVISPDGRYILFASTADNLVVMSNAGPVSGLLPARLNVFLRDRTNGTTRLVSVNLAGTGGGNGDSFPAAISANGRYALYESSATNLVAGDTNNASDIFVRDLVGGTNKLVSVTTNKTSGNGASRSPVMTPDGRYVAFVSAATNLVTGDTNGISDVFVRDLQGGTTVLASAGAIPVGGAAPPSGSAMPVITPDGRYAAFFSTATNLVTGLTNVGDIYVRDLVGGTTVCASTSARTNFQLVLGTSNTVSFNPVISDDGTYVAFESGTNIPVPAYGRGMIFRYNRQTGLIDIVHTNAHVPATAYEEIRNLDMTPDGRFIAFVANVSESSFTQTAVFLWDAQNGTNIPVSVDLSDAVLTNATCCSPVVTPDGRFVTFVSSATNLTTNVLAGDYHVYLRDLQAGVTKLLDADTNGLGIGVYPAMVPALSTNGGLVTFETSFANLDNRNFNYDVFVRDPAADAPALISARHPDLPSLTPNGPSTFSPFGVSTNGRYVAFVSDANNLVANDTNGYRDVFVRDRLNGTNFLVSVGLNGAAANGMSSEPAVSADGRYVAFSSLATNLAPGDTNNAMDVFVRDLQLGTNLLVSVSTTGGYGNGDSSSPVISADGRYVLFISSAKNLTAGSFSATPNLFLRDLSLRTNYALTYGTFASAAMTPDGHYVAFAGSLSSASSSYYYLYVWDSQAVRRIYTNDADSVWMVAINPNGQHAAFVMTGSTNWILSALDLVARTNWQISLGMTYISRAGLKFSADGRFLAYATTAANVSADGNLVKDVYLYDFQSGTNLLVSRYYNSSGSPNGPSDSPDISADGRFVAYRSFASNCVSGDYNEVSDLFLYDRLTGVTTPLTLNRYGTLTANNRSFGPIFSGDGRMLVFLSWASDLLAGDFNQGNDLFAAAAITDTDGDGMDDQWEFDHFGTLARNGSGDYDGDGATDLFEFLTGTDPTDRTSVFRAVIVYTAAPGQNPAISWPAVPGKYYSVQFKNSLNDSQWQDLTANVTLVGSTGYATDLVPATSQRFYRVVLVNY
jgi:Tol biopolymer transport system component